MGQNGEDRQMVVHLGPVAVDVPRSIGYFGGIGVAVAVGVLEPPLAVFIAAVPVLKMLMNPNAPEPLRFLGHIFDGASQPVGGEAQGTIRLENGPGDRSSDEVGQRD